MYRMKGPRPPPGHFIPGPGGSQQAPVMNGPPQVPPPGQSAPVAFASAPGQPPGPGSQPPQQQQVPMSHRAFVHPAGRASFNKPPNQPQMAGMVGPSGFLARDASMGGPTKKKRRIADKILPPQVRELVPESSAYMDLLQFEKKLDSTIARKRVEIQEAMKRPMKTKRKLRIYVSNTFFPGRDPAPTAEAERAATPSAPAGQPPTQDPGTLSSWELRVEGRLLEDGTGKQDSKSRRKFSSFFKSLVIELDKDLYGPDNHLVEWHRTDRTNETDGFQVKRPGDKNVKCTILLLLDYQPMKFKLDPRLARLLGVHVETRARIIEALWQYIKTHKLQDATEKDHINCDRYLEQIFQCPKMRFMEIPGRLNALLQNPDPVVINHVIQVEDCEPRKTSCSCYDIEVEVDDPLKSFMAQLQQSAQASEDVMALDRKIHEHVELIKQHNLQREFFLGFAEDPMGFIQKWVSSQCRDMKVQQRRAEMEQAMLGRKD